MSQVSLFGLQIQNVKLVDASASIIHDAKLNVRRKIYFINAHCVNTAAKNAQYQSVLHEEGVLLFADGIGMRLASRVADCQLVDNVNGTDLFPVLCQDAANTGVTLALLGARPGIAQRCADNMRKQFPNLKIVFIHDGYFNTASESEIIKSINDSKAHILFVAMGVPMQEFWVDRSAEKLNVPIILGVGALFDFYSGEMPRAPIQMRKLGLEWLFRLILEPRRLFVRYVLGNPVFIMRMIWRRLRGQKFLQKAPLINDGEQIS